jgi:hypothetical protein
VILRGENGLGVGVGAPEPDKGIRARERTERETRQEGVYVGDVEQKERK